MVMTDENKLDPERSREGTQRASASYGIDPRLHFVVATAIIVRDEKFLIAKRASHEKAFPNKWTPLEVALAGL